MCVKRNQDFKTQKMTSINESALKARQLAPVSVQKLGTAYQYGINLIKNTVKR